MQIVLAALLAAFLAAPVAYAADRPVGPETGQARSVNADGINHASEPEEVFGESGGPKCSWYCRWGWCIPRCGW